VWCICILYFAEFVSKFVLSIVFQHTILINMFSLCLLRFFFRFEESGAIICSNYSFSLPLSLLLRFPHCVSCCSWWCPLSPLSSTTFHYLPSFSSDWRTCCWTPLESFHFNICTFHVWKLLVFFIDIILILFKYCFSVFLNFFDNGFLYSFNILKTVD
jgi:hypothetical protein